MTLTKLINRVEEADWQPIETADGQPILNKRVRIKTVGGREFDAMVGWFAVDEDGHDCCAWAACNDWEAPECWSDGICWDFNMDGQRSDQPAFWVPPPDLAASLRAIQTQGEGE